MHPGTRYARLMSEHTTLTFGKQIQGYDNNRSLALNVRASFLGVLRRRQRVDDLPARPQSEPRKDRADVTLDGVFADAKCGGDFAIRGAAANQERYLVLALRQ